MSAAPAGVDATIGRFSNLTIDGSDVTTKAKIRQELNELIHVVPDTSEDAGAAYTTHIGLIARLSNYVAKLADTVLKASDDDDIGMWDARHYMETEEKYSVIAGLPSHAVAKYTISANTVAEAHSSMVVASTTGQFIDVEPTADSTAFVPAA